MKIRFKLVLLTLGLANLLLLACLFFPKLRLWEGSHSSSVNDFLSSFYFKQQFEWPGTELSASLLEGINPGAAKQRSYLTGLYRPDGAGPEQAVGVMIENLPAARPQQSGLGEADIVFEALAEGGITRFLAIFSPSDLPIIGPVRSARPYFVDWAEEFEAIFVHAGGSDEALPLIYYSDRLLDINENLEQFWRDLHYPRPHNLFSSMEKIMDYAASQDWQSALTEPYLRFRSSEWDKVDQYPAANTVSLDFSMSDFEVEYQYDASSKKYLRKQSGQEHLIIGPSNLIVFFTEYYPFDERGKLELRTQGEGIAWFLQEGRVVEGRWYKEVGQKTLFFDESGQEMTFRSGRTWIEIINDPKRVVLD